MLCQTNCRTQCLHILRYHQFHFKLRIAATILYLRLETGRKMGIWFPGKATKAYLNTIIMGESTREPNVSEFISALAAGNNSQLIVVACANIADSITLALVMAAQQTGGRLICIVPGVEELHASQELLGSNLSAVELVIGDAKTADLEQYEYADFITIDCDLEDHEEILRAVEGRRRQKNDSIIIGYNASRKGSWRGGGLDVEILPIGEGLLLRRIAAEDNNRDRKVSG